MDNPDRQLYIDSVEQMIEAYKRLPDDAMYKPATNRDILVLLEFIKALMTI